MADIFSTDDNSTPLSPEEREGLKPRWITTRKELNELETRNILEAETWLTNQKRLDVLNDSFLRKLHKKIKGSVRRRFFLGRKSNFLEFGNRGSITPQTCFNTSVSQWQWTSLPTDGRHVYATAWRKQVALGKRQFN